MITVRSLKYLRPFVCMTPKSSLTKPGFIDTFVKKTGRACCVLSHPVSCVLSGSVPRLVDLVAHTGNSTASMTEDIDIRHTTATSLRNPRHIGTATSDRVSVKLFHRKSYVLGYVILTSNLPAWALPYVWLSLYE